MELIYLVEDIGRRLQLKADMCVLDIDCGIGQLSKALIQRFGCRVIGIEESRSMHSLAPAYVLSERFTIWSPETLKTMVRRGFRADSAVAIRANVSATGGALALKPGACLYHLDDSLPGSEQEEDDADFGLGTTYASQFSSFPLTKTSRIRVLSARHS
jgi:SAM-dependent methyltransferase